MDWRSTSEKAIPWGERCALVATAIMQLKLSGYLLAHSSVIMPPIEPPTTARRRFIPKWSTTSFCTLTASPKVYSGKVML